ncbi:hypothetical protein [Deinococcus budaensis]|uniref:Uncharacterized protein n=1 Tax=Deinococcus budaensis TaxID=1665626 RepID=A0A7W8LNR6_9DEIO|nr:hypothetical protein [Deinococcus budaensis]MBB5232852.1 hypothetical protein [Deinococcus budaensis]
MEEALTTLAMFGSIFGGVALMTYVSGRQKIELLREKTRLAEAQRLALPPAAAPADPHAAPALALRLPEPQRTQALRLLCQLADAPADLDPRSAYLVRQTQAEYLPATLRAYLDLHDGARRRLAAQGLDPETLLSEQLGLIGEGLEDALRLDHAAADRVLTQGRFLRERFQTPDLLLDEPAPEPSRRG